MIHLTIAVASTFYQLSGGSPKDPLCSLEGDLSADFDAIGPGDVYPYMYTYVYIYIHYMYIYIICIYIYIHIMYIYIHIYHKG